MSIWRTGFVVGKPLRSTEIPLKPRGFQASRGVSRNHGARRNKTATRKETKPPAASSTRHRKITAVAVAVAARASCLEHEAARLRQKLADKDRLAAEHADRADALDQALRDADARLRVIRENDAKLVKERDSLVQTSRKLARDLAKLETFKRHLMQSLGDDNSSSQEKVDIRTCEQSVAKSSSWRGIYDVITALPLGQFSSLAAHCVSSVLLLLATTPKTTRPRATILLLQPPPEPTDLPKPKV